MERPQMTEERRDQIIARIYLVDWKTTTEQEAARICACSVEELREVQKWLDGEHD